MPEDLDLSTVELAYFEPLLHEKFHTLSWEKSTEQPPIELMLVRTAAHPLSAREGLRTPFSLFFDGPAGVPLAQGMRTFTHPSTGEMSLFIVPVACKADCYQVQAVFN